MLRVPSAAFIGSVPLGRLGLNLLEMFLKLRSFVLLTMMGSVFFASNTDQIARVIIEWVFVLVMND
jgi:hypothetical protein